MIELKNIEFSYGQQKILKDFSLSINDGQCVQLSGVSGSGKTSVARLILGLEKPQKGQIIAPPKISCVFQEDRLLENLDAQKNIRLVLSKDKYALADDLLKLFGLYEHRKKKVSQLSGGMKRRISLIRAITYGGDALILDEAFTGLDLENKRIAADVIKREFLDKNKSILLISHVTEDGDLLNAKIVNI